MISGGYLYSQITDNYISSDQVVCFNAIPDPLIGSQPSGGDGTYAYLWMVSYNDTLSWATAPGTNNQIDYHFSIGISLSPIFFRRQVSSGGYVSNSNIISITIASQPVQNNNIYSETFPDNSVCYNTSIIVGDTTLPTGGDGNYTFLWQDSTAGATWQDAPGFNYFEVYSTPLLTQNTFYRRLATSCGQTNISNVLEITVDPLPEYTVSIEDSICINDGAQIVINYQGALPWTYTLFDGVSYYTSDYIYDTQYFDYLTPTENSTYTINNVIDANGCEASNTGQVFDVTVLETPVANAGNDTVYCSNTCKLNAILTNTANTGVWTQMPNVVFNNPFTPNTKVNVFDYGTYTFEWTESNPRCSDTGYVTITFLKPLDDTINYAGEDVFLDFQLSYGLDATLPDNYTGYWDIIDGAGTFTDENNPNAVITDLGIGDNILTWTLSNNLCEDKTDTIIINVNDGIFVPSGFSPNSDGVNDVFFVKGLTSNFKAKLWVYNRWGILMYYNDDYKNDWNGTDFNKQALPNDTYFYILEIVDVKKFKGSLEIKR